MPELPEVETIRKGLQARLPGLRLVGGEIFLQKSVHGDLSHIQGASIVGVERLGKLLVFRFDRPYVMTIHLKMTGQLIWQPGKDSKVTEEVLGGHPEQSYLQPHPHKHTRTSFAFSDGSHLYFNDMRQFGKITILPEKELQEVRVVKTLAPEPASPEFTVAYLQKALARRARTAIKTALLDQTVIAGLGNIYADESLFRAKIYPTRRSGDLSNTEIERLHGAIKATLELALEHGGSSSQHYVDAVGNKGTFLAVATVYHRTGEACVVCGHPIERIKLGGRSTHFCPNCQK